MHFTALSAPPAPKPQEYALEHVALGDEDGARTALLQKAAVADALRQAARRAEANSALARCAAGSCAGIYPGVCTVLHTGLLL